MLITVILLPVSVRANDIAAISYADGIHCSFHAGSTQILFNGKEKSLQHAPFMIDGVFYLPLREVAELCGGIVKYMPSENSVMVALPAMGNRTEASFFQLWFESSKIECDGGLRETLPAIAEEGEGVLLKSDTAFIPIDYFFRVYFASPVLDMAGERAILFNRPYRAGIGPFNVEDDFNQLPAEIQDRFSATGKVD
ncbi:stalk domain-containing protein, partial [Dysgonomonas gadei]|uniref:stalk domain-containing protein n=1 Tax=Dysgonomonas gadei TaxID=156974 RepID=UPI003AF02BF6